QSVRPEFLNRIDETVMFTPLNLEEVEEIVLLQINALKASLAKKDIKLELSDVLISHLAKIGFEPQFGARPIKRVIQRVILNQLSKEILSGRLISNNTISIDLEGETLVFKNKS
ncbi:MAG: ATP-dependent Clp protease ATP-binding subunit ClpB, partial [Ancylomarina sp.]